VDVIQGRIDNDSRKRSIDWAAFIVNQTPLVPPIDPAQASRQLTIVGAALKRRTLDRLLMSHPDIPPELISTADLREAGVTVHVDQSLLVRHTQSESWYGHAALHFHNARAVSGRRRSAMTARDWFRLLAAPALFVYRSAVLLARAGRKDFPRWSAAGAAPGIIWLFFWKGAGEIIGYLTGPGDSARRLH
jgi:hypothetical protein